MSPCSSFIASHLHVSYVFTPTNSFNLVNSISSMGWPRFSVMIFIQSPVAIIVYCIVPIGFAAFLPSPPPWLFYDVIDGS